MQNDLSLKEQIVHILSGSVFFLILAAIAIIFDLSAIWVKSLGVSEFTSEALTLSSHGLLIFDILLFINYLVKSSFQLFKGKFK